MNQVINKKVYFKELGLIDYQMAWDYQTEIYQGIVDTKILNRTLEPDKQLATENHLIFCEHPHVYTLGKSGDRKNLLMHEHTLKSHKISYYEINRGGDITYHGPGQLVVYPVIDLENFFTDIHRYMRCLEESVILTLAEYGIKGARVEGLTGVWIHADNPAKAGKICALGVKTGRWVAMHGLALNINTDLSYFNNIIPCGISDKSVTSMSQELGKKVDQKEVTRKLLGHLASVFEMEIV